MNFSALKELQHGLLHMFYPRLCEGCSKPLLAAELVLCIGCDMEMPETDYHELADNDSALRFAGRIPYIYATSFAYFTNEGLLQHLLHGLKYGNKQEIGTFLGRRLGYALQKTKWISSVDMIIPVPLHSAKQASRGFNQSMLIAEGMSEILGIPTDDKILIRVRNTDSQTHKTRTERVENMSEAFKLTKSSHLKGKHILLVDDVLTTGATLEACAMALRQEESIKISLATIGIAIS